MWIILLVDIISKLLCSIILENISIAPKDWFKSNAINCTGRCYYGKRNSLLIIAADIIR